MKPQQIAELPEGTKLYHVHFEAETSTGRVEAEVRECVVRTPDPHTGRGAYRLVKDAGPKASERWESVRSRNLYPSRDEAERELTFRLARLAHTLAVFILKRTDPPA